MSEPIDQERTLSPQLAALIDVLAEPPQAGELGGGAEAVAAMQANIGAITAADPSPKVNSSPRLRIAATAAAGLIILGGAAAAARPTLFGSSERPPVSDAPPAGVPSIGEPPVATDQGPDTSATVAAPSAAATTTPPGTESTLISSEVSAPDAMIADGEIVCAAGNHGATVNSVGQAAVPSSEAEPGARAARSACGKQGGGRPNALTAGGDQTPDPGPPPGSPRDTAPGPVGQPGSASGPLGDDDDDGPGSGGQSGSGSGASGDDDENDDDDGPGLDGQSGSGSGDDDDGDGPGSGGQSGSGSGDDDDDDDDGPGSGASDDDDDGPGSGASDDDDDDDPARPPSDAPSNTAPGRQRGDDED